VRLPITISANLGCLVALLQGLCVAGLLLGAASEAEGRTETLKWSHQSPPACDGFRVYVGPSKGNYTKSADAGLPPRRSDGTYAVRIWVPDEETVWVAVRAYNSAGLSPFSNAQQRIPEPEGSPVEPEEPAVEPEVPAVEPPGRPGQPRLTGP
jgi:hypothetical protein